MQIGQDYSRLSFNYIIDTENLPSRVVTKIFNFAPAIFRELGTPFLSPKLKSFKQMTHINLETIVDATVDIYHHGMNWAYEEKVQRILQDIDAERLHDLIESLVNKEVRENIPGLYMKLSPFLSVEQIKGAIQIGEQVVRELDKLIHIEIQNPRCSITVPQNKQFFNNVISNFFPNLFNILRLSFLYFDEGNQPKMIWECYLILSIYFQVLTIPFALVFTLSPLIGFSSALAVIGVGSVLGFSALYGYFNWLRPFPIKMNHYTVNLTRKEDLGCCVSRDHVISEIIKFQGGLSRDKKHVLVVGDSGQGKSTVLKGAVKKLKEIKSDINVYDASLAIGGGTNMSGVGPLHRLQENIKNLGPLATRSVFVLNEFSRVVLSKSSHDIDTEASSWSTFLDTTVVTCWATATIKQYEAILKYDANEALDQGEALLQRFHIVDLRKSVADVRSMVDAEMRYKKGYIPCDPDLAHNAIKLSGEYRPKINQPRNACNLIDLAIAEVRFNLEKPSVKTQEQKNIESRLVIKRRELCDIDRTEPGSDDVRSLEEEIEEMERLLKDEITRMNVVNGTIHHLRREYKRKLAMERRIYDVACLLRQDEGNVDLQKEFHLLRYYDFSVRQSVVREWEDDVPEGYPVRVTEAVLESEIKKKVPEPKGK
ncbi:MAG: hypothetical protein K940chlam3_01360 [Chlamydiae bacterium]|nr:hypothetical protein [Chlamydiota bacterium]